MVFFKSNYSDSVRRTLFVNGAAWGIDNVQTVSSCINCHASILSTVYAQLLSTLHYPPLNPTVGAYYSGAWYQPHIKSRCFAKAPETDCVRRGGGGGGAWYTRLSGCGGSSRVFSLKVIDACRWAINGTVQWDLASRANSWFPGRERRLRKNSCYES